MSDKKKLKLKSTNNPNNQGKSFFAPSLKKTSSEGQLSLSGTAVPSPVISRGPMGISATIYFDQNSFFLNSENFEAVKKLSEDLQYLADPRVIVDGHASKEGEEPYNLKLSENRRNGIIAILNSTKKMKPINYEGKAYGESQPVIPEKGETKTEKEEQRKFNRRVEIMILFDPATIKNKEEKKKKLTDLKYRPTPEDFKRWEQEQFNRRLWETPYVPPYEKKSLNELLWKKFDESLDTALRKMKIPEKLRPWIKKGARSAIEKGTETILDKALDQTGLGSDEKKAIKKSIEAIGKTELFPQ